MCEERKKQRKKQRKKERNKERNKETNRSEERRRENVTADARWAARIEAARAECCKLKSAIDSNERSDYIIQFNR